MSVQGSDGFQPIQVDITDLKTGKATHVQIGDCQVPIANMPQLQTAKATNPQAVQNNLNQLKSEYQREASFGGQAVSGLSKFAVLLTSIIIAAVSVGLAGIPIWIAMLSDKEGAKEIVKAVLKFLSHSEDKALASTYKQQVESIKQDVQSISKYVEMLQKSAEGLAKAHIINSLLKLQEDLGEVLLISGKGIDKITSLSETDQKQLMSHYSAQFKRVQEEMKGHTEMFDTETTRLKSEIPNLEKEIGNLQREINELRQKNLSEVEKEKDTIGNLKHQFSAVDAERKTLQLKIDQFNEDAKAFAASKAEEALLREKVDAGKYHFPPGGFGPSIHLSAKDTALQEQLSKLEKTNKENEVFLRSRVDKLTIEKKQLLKMEEQLLLDQQKVIPSSDAEIATRPALINVLNTSTEITKKEALLTEKQKQLMNAQLKLPEKEQQFKHASIQLHKHLNELNQKLSNIAPDKPQLASRSLNPFPSRWATEGVTVTTYSETQFQKLQNGIQEAMKGLEDKLKSQGVSREELFQVAVARQICERTPPKVSPQQMKQNMIDERTRDAREIREKKDALDALDNLEDLVNSELEWSVSDDVTLTSTDTREAEIERYNNIENQAKFFEFHKNALLLTPPNYISNMIAKLEKEKGSFDNIQIKVARDDALGQLRKLEELKYGADIEDFRGLISEIPLKENLNKAALNVSARERMNELGYKDLFQFMEYVTRSQSPNKYNDEIIILKHLYDYFSQSISSHELIFKKCEDFLNKVSKNNTDGQQIVEAIRHRLKEL